MSYLGNKMKSIISICAIVLTIAVISMLGYSMSTDGSNPVYTRDELSERITQLEQENNELKYNGSRITTYLSTNFLVNGNVVKNIPYSEYETNGRGNEIFELRDGKILIKRNGNYLIQSYAVLNSDTAGATTYFYTTYYTYNGIEAAMTYEGSSYQAGTKSSHMSDSYYFMSGTEVYVKTLMPTTNTITYARLSLTYLG